MPADARAVGKRPPSRVPNATFEVFCNIVLAKTGQAPDIVHKGCQRLVERDELLLREFSEGGEIILRWNTEFDLAIPGAVLTRIMEPLRGVRIRA